MSLHKSLAYVVLMEGIANLILSIVLVRPLGIVGDAIGTAIPTFMHGAVFLATSSMPPVGYPGSQNSLWKHISTRWCFASPWTFVLLLMQRSFYAHRYPQLVLNLTAGIAVYGVGVLWFVLTREPLGIQLKTRMSRYFGLSGQSQL